LPSWGSASPCLRIQITASKTISSAMRPKLRVRLS
jgi:hypothetical protein